MLSKSLTEISAVIGAHDYALQRNTLISIMYQFMAKSKLKSVFG